MKKSIYLVVVLTIMVSVKTFSQAAFSLVDMNKMVIDPAFAGIDTSYKNTASFYGKTDINNFGITENSSMATWQMNLDKMHSGAGIMFNYNYWNFPTFMVNNQYAAKLYYRYTILPGLSVGADAGFVNLNTQYEIPGYLGGAQPLKPINDLDFDGGLGLLYQYKSIYAGFSVDHITSPQATLPLDVLTGEGKSPMPYYGGPAYNGIIGGNIPLGKCSIDISASYCSEVLNLNTTLNVPHFFAGFSTLFPNYQNNADISEILDINNAYYAFMAGIKAYHNEIKLYFCYNYQSPKTQGFWVFNSIEGGVSLAF